VINKMFRGRRSAAAAVAALTAGALSAVCVAAAPALASTTNLVVNGSFDAPAAAAPPPGPGFIELSATDPATRALLTDWTVFAGSVDWYHHAWLPDPPASGYYLDMNGSGPGTIEQDQLPTLPGLSYDLDFDLAANPQCFGGYSVAKLGIWWDHAAITGPAGPVLATAVPNQNQTLTWVHYHYQVTGAGADSLTFTSQTTSTLGSPQFPCGPLLADVTLARHYSAPVNLTPPTITGYPYTGATVHGDLGSWGGDHDATAGAQWLACASTDAGTCAPIPDGSGLDYLLGPDTVGKWLRLSVTMTDGAGQQATATSAAFGPIGGPPIVTVPPAPLIVEATSPAGATINYASLVSATDPLESPLTLDCRPASGDTFSLGSTTITCTASNGISTASASFTAYVVDTTAPVVTVPAPITATAATSAGTPVMFTATADDLVDGPIPPTCTPASGAVFAPGTTTVTCTAADARDNTGTASFAVTVAVPQQPWSGYLQPINADGSSIFKLGSTVPVKFTLPSGGASAVTATLSLAKVSSGIDGSYLEATSTAQASTGNTFRYDAAAGQYIFNLSTKGLTSGTWRLRANLGDGNPDHTVLISLR
jgi:hypothetical protein